MSLTNCRFYEEKYPEIDSFVMVNVKQVRFRATYWPQCGSERAMGRSVISDCAANL